MSSPVNDGRHFSRQSALVHRAYEASDLRCCKACRPGSTKYHNIFQSFACVNFFFAIIIRNSFFNHRLNIFLFFIWYTSKVNLNFFTLWGFFFFDVRLFFVSESTTRAQPRRNNCTHTRARSGAPPAEQRSFNPSVIILYNIIVFNYYDTVHFFTRLICT